MIRLRFLLIPAMALVLAPRSTAQGTKYTIIEIATPADADYVARGLNNKGHVVGRAGSSLGPGTRAFFWQGDRNIEGLSSLEQSDYSVAAGINDLDEIAGALNFGDSIRAFMIVPGNPRQLLAHPPGDNASQAFAINQSGDIAGYTSGASGEQACIWTRNGNAERIGVPTGGHSSKALAVSDSGHVVGSAGMAAGPHAFLWTRKNGIQDLGVLPGDFASEAFGVNNAGDVVGYSRGPRGMHAVRWTQASGMQDLGLLTGDKHSRALDISNSGEIIGSSAGPSGARAFIWTSKDGMQDLNLLIPVNLALRLIEAHAINDRGQIIAFGTDSRDGHDHESANRLFLLTPAGGR